MEPHTLSIGGFFARVLESSPMPSETTILLRSIRRWLLATTFVLGVSLVTLAHAGYVISGYQGEVIFNVATVIGGITAVAAGGTWLLFPATESHEDTE